MIAEILYFAINFKGIVFDIAYNLQILMHIAQVQRSFRAAVSAWRKCAIRLESLLADSEDIESLKQGRDELNEAMDHVAQVHGKLEDLSNPDPTATERHEAVEHDNLELINKTCQRIISTLNPV